VVCGGDTTKCCSNPRPLPGPIGCIKKCDPTGATCPHKTPGTGTTLGCEREAPDNYQCADGQVGKTCQWILDWEYTSSAKCASCEPFCGITRDSYCAFYKAQTCRNAFFLGCVCEYVGDAGAQPTEGVGDHYACP
jgi:hypothetical protein